MLMRVKLHALHVAINRQVRRLRDPNAAIPDVTLLEIILKVTGYRQSKM